MFNPHEPSLYCEVKYTLPISIHAKVAAYVNNLMYPNQGDTPGVPLGTPPHGPPSGPQEPPRKRLQQANHNNAAARRKKKNRENAKPASDAPKSTPLKVEKAEPAAEPGSIEAISKSSSKKSQPTGSRFTALAPVDSDSDIECISQKQTMTVAQKQTMTVAQKRYQNMLADDQGADDTDQACNERKLTFYQVLDSAEPNKRITGKPVAKPWGYAPHPCIHEVYTCIKQSSNFSVSPRGAVIDAISNHYDNDILDPLALRRLRGTRHHMFLHVLEIIAKHISREEDKFEEFEVVEFFMAFQDDNIWEYLDENVTN